MPSRKMSTMGTVGLPYNDFSAVKKRTPSRAEISEETRKALKELEGIQTIAEFKAACERAALRNNERYLYGKH